MLRRLQSDFTLYKEKHLHENGEVSVEYVSEHERGYWSLEDSCVMCNGP